MIGDSNVSLMNCPNSKCGFAFCFKCKEMWHSNMTCEENEQWKIDKGNLGPEELFIKWRNKHSKPCPNCKVNIEKNSYFT